MAIKVLRRELAERADYRARLLEEARIAGPQTARIYDVLRLDDGRPALVLEWIDGVPLDLLISCGALRRDRALALLQEICAAVAAVHEAGFVHRDVKAENILVCVDAEGRERVKLLDFGLAHALGGAPCVSEEGLVVGTPAYLSPEQIVGERADAQSDVYALGVLAYRMLTGEFPFKGESEVVMLQHLQVAPPKPVGLERSLRRGVMGALAKGRGDRLGSARELAEALV